MSHSNGSPHVGHCGQAGVLRFGSKLLELLDLGHCDRSSYLDHSGGSTHRGNPHLGHSDRSSHLDHNCRSSNLGHSDGSSLFGLNGGNSHLSHSDGNSHLGHNCGSSSLGCNDGSSYLGENRWELSFGL